MTELSRLNKPLRDSLPNGAECSWLFQPALISHKINEEMASKSSHNPQKAQSMRQIQKTILSIVMKGDKNAFKHD